MLGEYSERQIIDIKSFYYLVLRLISFVYPRNSLYLIRLSA